MTSFPLLTLPLVGFGLLEAPSYSFTAWRGRGVKLWAAVLDVKENGRIERTFIPRGKGAVVYHLDEVKPLDVIEFGRNTEAISRRERFYGIVIDVVKDSHILIEPMTSANRAIVEARKRKIKETPGL